MYKILQDNPAWQRIQMQDELNRYNKEDAKMLQEFMHDLKAFLTTHPKQTQLSIDITAICQNWTLLNQLCYPQQKS